MIREWLYALVCWLRRHLPASADRRRMRQLVKRHFELHNWNPIDRKRWNLYRGLRWSIRRIPLWKVGLWDRAQGLPHEWCMGNVLETARLYRETDAHEGAYLSKIGIFEELSPDKVLDTIIVVDGRLRRGRELCADQEWSIDDGCMRALTHAIDEGTQVQAYVGEIF